MTFEKVAKEDLAGCFWTQLPWGVPLLECLEGTVEDAFRWMTSFKLQQKLFGYTHKRENEISSIKAFHA